jgi:hypothetical protein
VEYQSKTIVSHEFGTFMAYHRLTRQKDSLAFLLDASTPRSASLRFRRVVMVKMISLVLSRINTQKCALSLE